MPFATHPKFDKSKKWCITVGGKKCVVRVVDGKCISPNQEHQQAFELEKAYKGALKKLGVEE